MQRMILVDTDKCVGCYACVVACKLRHRLPPHPVHPPRGNPHGPELIRVYEVDPSEPDGEAHQCFQGIACMHCLDAPCIGACPRSAIYKDLETCITVVDDAECIGCMSCLSACPYGAPQFHDGSLMLCDLCIDRLEDGRRTDCEAACPARAISVGTIKEPSTGVGGKAAN